MRLSLARLLILPALAALFALAMAPSNASAAAAARTECEFLPYLRHVSRTLLVPDTRLFCREVQEDPVHGIRRARELFELCEQMGGTKDDCRHTLISSDEPSFEDLRTLFTGQRHAAKIRLPAAGSGSRWERHLRRMHWKGVWRSH